MLDLDYLWSIENTIVHTRTMGNQQVHVPGVTSKLPIGFGPLLPKWVCPTSLDLDHNTDSHSSFVSSTTLDRQWRSPIGLLTRHRAAHMVWVDSQPEQ